LTKRTRIGAPTISGPRPSLEEIQIRPQPVEDSPEFLVDVLQLLEKAEAVAQSRALLQAIFMPDAIVDRRRPSNGKIQQIRRFA
jgi:hypothetical protein